VYKLLADKHLTWLEKLLGDSWEIDRFENPEELHQKAEDADALLIRTVTPVNRTTFPKFPEKLKCVVTATAGFDHVDTEWLKENDIAFSPASGCNARSVGEYVLFSMLYAYDFNLAVLRTKKVGLVGYGKTGRETARLLQKLSIPYIFTDPPLEESDPGQLNFSTLDDVLDCNIVSLHIPLTDDGNFPTKHLLSKNEFEDRSIELLINASRGGVINEKDLIRAQARNEVGRFVIDVWCNEPEFNTELRDRALIATPHVAGYSMQSKFRASLISCRFLTNHFKTMLNVVDTGYAIRSLKASTGLAKNASRIHPMFDMDEKMRSFNKSVRAEKFLELRNTTELRHEFPYFRLLNLDPADQETAKALRFEINE